MTLLRNIVFTLLFYGGSLLIVGTVPLSALIGHRALHWHVRFWAWYHRWSARLLLGIRTRVIGTIPTGTLLFVAKHESMFETIELMLMLDAPVVVMKAELMRVPVWGWAAKTHGAMMIDRDGSSAALRQMRRQGEAARAAGRPILIFPEGTRVLPGEAPPLKAGFAGLYRLLALPIVPVAIDSGKVWPKRGLKRAGTITFKFGEVIPPGLNREEAEARVHAEMNALN